MVEVFGRVIRVSLVDNVRFKEKVEENEDLSQMAIWMKSIPGRREYWNHILCRALSGHCRDCGSYSE